MELARDGAALAGEEVLADERLPRRELVAGELTDAARDVPDAVEAQLGLDAVEPAQRERDLGEVRVAGALAHAVDRPLDPARAGPDRRHGRRRREAEVVVTVEVDGDVRPEPLDRAPDELRGRLGARHAERVDDDDLARAGLDGRRVGALEERQVGARAVDAEVGDADAVPCGEPDRTRDPAEHLVARDAERLELEVGDGRLDHARLQAELDERLDVGRDSAREAPDLGPKASPRDELDGAPVLVRYTREPGLDPLDPELVDRARELELLLRREDDAHRLFPVPKGRVVEADLGVEAMAVVDGAGPEAAAHRKSSGIRDSRSGAPPVTRKSSSSRRPPPPSQ